MVLSDKIFNEFKDPRYFQILFLGSFLTYGLLYLGWQANWLNYAASLGTAIVTQIVFCILYKKPLSAVKSAFITAFGLSLLLKASAPWVFALAAFVAISAKFLLRYKGKHLFNPANIGIVVCLLFTNEAWVSPGQWGNDTILVFFMGVAGLTVLLRINRLETTIVFLSALLMFQYLRLITYLGWDLAVLWHKFSSGTLLLFAFFMITDPMTIPNHKKARIPWAVIVAFITFVLSQWFYVYTAAIWALFIVTPLTVLFDHWWEHKKFEWQTPFFPLPITSNPNK